MTDNCDTRPVTGLVLAIVVGITACVSYPEPDIQTQQAATAGLAPGEMVTVLSVARTNDQTSFADCVHDAMSETEPDLAIMPGRKFRDALYPWFEPATFPTSVDELTALLARPAVKRRIEELNVRYVAVVDGNTSRRNEGSFICTGGGYGGGCLGYSSEDRESRITAALWDLEQGASAGEVSAKTTGTNVSIGVLVPVLFFSATESAACDGLGHRLAQLMSGRAPLKAEPDGRVPNAVYVE